MMGAEYQRNLESDLEMPRANIHEVIWSWTNWNAIIYQHVLRDHCS